uniref:Uncharacterized protein n=1 Tax=Glossina pallidipes TaxID=7398 RepID=A0A1B0AGN0_GLOPL
MSLRKDEIQYRYYKRRRQRNDENSHIHAILTNDNLLDGTIETNTDHFYIEPSQRYSRNLNDTGIHSIIYRLSDVDMRRRDAFMKSKKKTSSSVASVEHCASERLKRSILLDELKRRMASGEEIRLYNFQAEAEADAETFNVSMNDDYRQHKSERLKGHLEGKANCLHRRFKRWLPEESFSWAETMQCMQCKRHVVLSSSGDGNKNDPPLPLDLEVPYNDDFSIFANMDNGHGYATTSTSASGNRFNKSNDKLRTTQQASVITWRNAAVSTITSTSTPSSSSTKYNRSRNIIVNNYNPNSNDDSNNSYNYNNNNNNNNNNIRKTYTKHKNIIVSTYNNNNNNNNNSSRSPSSYDRVDDFNDSSQNGGNGFFNNNWTTIFMGGNDRPIHKTHVEIITKNGATKKPNIIVNNYNPDIVMSPNPHNPNFNSMLMTNLLTNRGGSNNGDTVDNPGSGKSLYDRKITCMLYLQADHTFFQKMGSDEASIEAITRHVQRANSIYKNTGEYNKRYANRESKLEERVPIDILKHG